ncbi:MAG: DUF4296 domain-containing protein [Bacteroidales bacterium]|nr:DUF4296 domain-containing protein [Bacteroidales bacterium]MBN2749809.1 DUF4296 domain-containing protein [Bacteroidales bacterium]
MRKYIAVAVLVFLAISCANQNTIPEKELTNILVEMFIADATVIAPNYRAQFSKKDSIEYYEPILAKYGYSLADFDQTMTEYSKEPKKLDIIFDNVVIELSKMEEELRVGNEAKMDSLRMAEFVADTTINLWDQKTEFRLPSDGRQNGIPYKISVIGMGTYTLTADVTVFPDDETVQPSMSAFFCYDDGTAEGFRSTAKYQSLIKDGRSHKISLSVDLKDVKYTHISGHLVEHGAREGDWSKQIIISNIRLTFKPVKEDLKRLKRQALDTKVESLKER